MVSNERSSDTIIAAPEGLVAPGMRFEQERAVVPAKRDRRPASLRGNARPKPDLAVRLDSPFLDDFSPYMYEALYLGIVQRVFQIVGRRSGEKAVRRHFFDPALGGSLEGETRVQGKFDDLREAGVVVVIHSEGLAAYRPPLDADADRVISGTRRSPTGTTIHPSVAEWLYRRREHLEGRSLLTAFAWCTHCGQLFKDGRAEHVRIARTRIARWCSSCRGTRRRHLPQRRNCAASDCPVLFTPTRANQLYCSGACRTAEGARVSDLA